MPIKEKKEEISETLTYREAVSRKVSGMIQEVVSYYPSLKTALSVKLRWQGRKAFWDTYESSSTFYKVCCTLIKRHRGIGKVFVRKHSGTFLMLLPSKLKEDVCLLLDGMDRAYPFRPNYVDGDSAL